ncbi:hypothetical protein C0Q70_04555 [Pomacea canaliculata]|uniref:RRM domain-containing protein n=2 Tax=Pomacea canaliculata TaxID=400727 RepID=A0A2T7PIQ5_POMCA|nr:hypothetical protein C0Q70_04555 [Pomacea canaliculata]
MARDLKCKVYVGDLGYGAAKEELEEKFSKYGPLRSVWVARKPPGFAFVEFEDSRDAADAVRALDGTRINGGRVRVELSSGKRRSDRRSPPRNKGGSSGGGGGGGSFGARGRGSPSYDDYRLPRRSRSASPRRSARRRSESGSPFRRRRSRSRS